MAKKHKGNKPHGHYCKVCGEHKANEKFSGKGHAAHICKKCAALPVPKRNEMMTLNRIGGMTFRYLSESEIKWLRGKMNDSRPEVREAARDAYGMKFPGRRRVRGKTPDAVTPVLFSELDGKRQAEVARLLEELIGGFFIDADAIPGDADRDEILNELCEEASEILNRWEHEPYDPVKEYYDSRFDFGPEVGFDERVALMREIFESEADEHDEYDDGEPEPEPRKELQPDDGLKAVFDGIAARLAAGPKAGDAVLPGE
jgi:hypothetical protein